ncbi:MAG TPA: dienelactone hydrolase family protein [Mycobacteriales bacterium]|nr:dienelactone hydrolase family protein [Mycobacteriales bacterium]
MPDTHYDTPHGRLRGYLATPSGEGPWPGVVVIHEAFGLVDDMRHEADRFAEHGYVAFAPDLYSYGLAPKCLVATMRTLVSGGGGRALDDIDAARKLLVDRDDCTGKVGIIGFCMGGGFAILCARRGFDASAPNYGMVPKNVEEVLAGACPVVASYGAKDRGFKGAAAKLERALAANNVEHDVKEYAEAGHSFLTNQTGRWAFVARVPGFGHVEAAAEDAWSRVFAFFGKHLAESGK